MKLRSFPKNTPLALACAALFTPLVYGQDSAPTTTLDEVVVTAIHDQSAVQVVTDPKIPRQPVPASDAADYLQTIPGFSAVRSGGTNGDPVFRGQFGSRLPLLTNGMQMLGACPGRMDTPSSYIAPETFDVLTLIKGPQTVLWGPGACAAFSGLLGAHFGQSRQRLCHPGARKNHPAGRGCQLEGAKLAVLDLGLRRDGARLHPVRLRQQPQQGTQH